MSFNRLNYDTKAYQQIINESIGPGVYQINKPKVSCEQCYPSNPSIRLQGQGVSVDKNDFMIDIDSELMGITRRASNVPSKKYVPCCQDTECSSGHPCGQGVAAGCKNVNRGSRPSDKNLHHWKECFVPQENCRLSNPPCTLRGTGWNRWEWLCQYPQDRVEIPFDWNISNRILFKDNHRPCIPTPIDPTSALPKGGKLNCQKINSTCSVPTEEPSVHWQNCGNLKKY